MKIKKIKKKLKAESMALEINRAQFQSALLNYAQSGASTRKIAFRGSYDFVNSTKEDIEDNKEILTARSRQLFMGNTTSRAAILKIRTNVVGSGLKVKSRINNDFLGISSEQAETMQKNIEFVWKSWAESTECDIMEECNFYQLQDLAIMTMLIDGDCFIYLPYKNKKDNIFNLKMQFLDSGNCKSTSSDENIYEGVEFNKDYTPIAYHFINKDGENFRIPVKDSTGRKQILKLMEKERIGQLRGVPLLSPVMEPLAQLGKFTNAELMSAVVSAMFTAFIKQDVNTGNSGKMLGVPQNFTSKPTPDNQQQGKGIELSMGYGNLGILEPGQDMVFANPNRPNSKFEVFFNAIMKQISASLEIPFEVLLSCFNSNYSASRAAIMEAWKMYKRRRTWLSQMLCQPIFEQVIEEAVLKNYIELPGFFENKLKRKAYLGTTWYGDAQGQLDPVKEVNASILKIQNGLSTLERESMEINGSDWNENLQQQKNEIKIKQEVGMNGNIEFSTEREEQSES